MNKHLVLLIVLNRGQPGHPCVQILVLNPEVGEEGLCDCIPIRWQSKCFGQGVKLAKEVVEGILEDDPALIVAAQPH